jgi:hypothetical protein
MEDYLFENKIGNTLGGRILNYIHFYNKMENPIK